MEMRLRCVAYRRGEAVETRYVDVPVHGTSAVSVWLLPWRDDVDTVACEVVSVE